MSYILSGNTLAKYGIAPAGAESLRYFAVAGSATRRL